MRVSKILACPIVLKVLEKAKISSDFVRIIS
jgi:hypothetical protein